MESGKGWFEWMTRVPPARLPALAVAVAAAALLHPAITDSQTAAPPPEELIVLGDSLSDIGNAAGLADYLLDEASQPEHGLGLCNPADVFLLGRGCADIAYRQSRVSDGPVAVEHLAMHLGLPELVASFHVVPDRPAVGSNYAIAGAKAGGADVSDLSRQVDALVLDRGPTLPADALYVVMIGGNDAIDALQASVLPSVTDPGSNFGDAGQGGSGGNGSLPGSEPDTGLGDSSTTSAEIVAAAVAQIGATVDRLIDSGARRLIVVNVPDLSILPAVRARAEQAEVDEQQAMAAAQRISIEFNTQLDSRLAQARTDHPGAVLTSFDLFSFLDELHVAAAADGINVSDACFDSEAYRDSWMAQRNFHSGCAPLAEDGIPRFEQFFFWDEIHPSSFVHAAIGEALFEATQQAGAP